MRQVALLPRKDKEDLFRNTASAMKINEAIVEKDFWVCWVLDYLFHRCPWKEHFAFKGGTSLSKVYGLIQRFSEDIDLIIDWRVLGYKTDEPWQKRSNTKQLLFNNQLKDAGAHFLKEQFLPLLIKQLSEELGREILCKIDPKDRQTINFFYPKSFSSTSLRHDIRLEIGALAAWSPSSHQAIMPYAAKKYETLFLRAKTNVRTVSAERTFWEKATILHHEANRPMNSKMPPRYARHYYDLYKMSQSSVRHSALEDLSLLQQVISFKMKFYRRGWAKYEVITDGLLRLCPEVYRYDELARDYQAMKEMFFADAPSFDALMRSLSLLEEAINQRIRFAPYDD